MPRHRLSRNLFYERPARVRITGRAAFSPHRVTMSRVPGCGGRIVGDAGRRKLFTRALFTCTPGFARH